MSQRHKKFIWAENSDSMVPTSTVSVSLPPHIPVLPWGVPYNQTTEEGKQRALLQSKLVPVIKSSQPLLRGTLKYHRKRNLPNRQNFE